MSVSSRLDNYITKYVEIVTCWGTVYVGKLDRVNTREIEILGKSAVLIESITIYVAKENRYSTYRLHTIQSVKLVY